MTGLYVVSNPTALTASFNLDRSMTALTDVLTRLSTGLRINSGKDDPAGLIASELLKSDITATTKAIKNTQQANSMIAIADSALGQISALLNDIRGLVNEAANGGAMSDDMIAANQLQIDASLDSIDRIARTTNYQGKLILDGSLAFTTTGISNQQLESLNVYQANFGTASEIDVTINVKQVAQPAQLYFNQSGISEAVVLEVGGNQGSYTFPFEAGASVEEMARQINFLSDSTGVRAIVGKDATNGQLLATSAGFNNDINFTAVEAGAAGGNYSIKYVAGNSDETTYTITEPSDGKPGVIEFQLRMEPWGNAEADGLDESYNGIYTTELTDADGVGNGFVIQSDNGKYVKSYSVAQTSGAATQPSVDYDAKTGHLQILLNTDANGDVTTTYAELVEAISKIDGLAVVQLKDTPAVGDLNSIVNFGWPDGVGGPGTAHMTPITSQPTIDVRANNKIDITAKATGPEFENTDVVYLQGPPAGPAKEAAVIIADVAAGTAYAGANQLTFTAVNGGADMNGYTFSFIDDANAAAATVDGKNVVINTNGTFTDVDINAVLNTVGIEMTGMVGAIPNSFAVDASVVNAAAGPNTTNQPLMLSGGADAVPDVAFHYSSSASKSAVTIAAAPAALGTAAQQYMRLTATNAGGQYNEVGVEFVTTGGPLTVSYDEEAKMLRIYGGDAPPNQASLGQLKAAIEAKSPFKAEFFTDVNLTQSADLSKRTEFSQVNSSAYDSASAEYSVPIMTGQNAANLGTDHQGLVITVAQRVPPITANEIVQAFKNDPLSTLFTMENSPDSNGTGTIFWNGADVAGVKDAMGYDDPASFVYSAAMKGGTVGYETAVTARELVDFVNNDEVLSKLIHADLALNSPTGAGKMTLFEEYVYYGDPNAGTGLQFLGPKGSADIIFACNLDSTNQPLRNQPLDVYFTPDQLGYSQIDIEAKNANAAVRITADTKGGDYDDMVVRYVRLGNDQTQSSVKYEEGPSNAVAYCSINDANTGTTLETGKFIVSANERGELYNDVAIVAKLDRNQTEDALAYFDKESGRLVISVNSVDVKLTDAVAAINNEGTFSADYDFSYNHNTDDTGPANSTFANILSNASTTREIGNTGQTGGHTGGVLTVYMAGDDDPSDPMVSGGPLSAQAVVDLINNDPVAAGKFTASNYGTSTGRGLVSFRDDNVKSVTGGCGSTFTIPASTSSGGIAERGVMVIQLATDQYGNTMTTARELVDFFDQLTAEQTRGVSVSLVRPVGVDNLNRTWVDDGCGNISVVQACEDDYGNGILAATCSIDECDNVIYDVLRFTSFGSDIQNANSNGDLITVNGWESQFNVSAKTPGPDYDGVSIVYEVINDPITEPNPSASYDETKKQIVVRIFDGVTTAAEVKAAIEADKLLNDLFSVTLRQDGAAAVTKSDDSLSTAHGTYEAGYRGGASLLGASDADPHSLTLESTGVGRNQFVTVNVTKGKMDIKDADGKIVNRTYGSDADATLNGNKMVANGNNLSLSTSMLNLDTILSGNVRDGDVINFKITGGGATFQLGPDVTTSQQIRIGIPSVSSVTLGGPSGKMYQLRSGGDASLKEDTKLADRIVQEAITAIASLRGRLGAIQRCTLDPNIASLQDNLEEMVSAEADITNADFAVESANLARAQILVQAGARVAGIANQLPQYAASLLG